MATGWQPKNNPRAYGARVFHVDDSAPKIKKPRKKREPKPLRDPDLFSDEENRVHSLKLATRGAKAKAAHFYSMASDASDEQWEQLRGLLDYPQRSSLLRFVEFANQLSSGVGTVNRWDKGKVWMTAIYFRRAIQMALHGENDLCSANDEFAVSCGYEDFFDYMFEWRG